MSPDTRTVVVVTGSTRGIGRGLAKAFLQRACSVVVSGRAQTTCQAVADQLSAEFGQDRVIAQACDVTQIDKVETLWQSAMAAWGHVDIWINNAGLGENQAPILDTDPQTIKQIIDTNIKGAIFGSQVALRGMRAQGFGALYNMEGLGSDGRRVPGLSIYGSSKYALRYLNQSLATEVKALNQAQGGQKLIAGALSPGMVLTELLSDNMHEDWQQQRILKILVDRVETVCPWLAERALKNRRNGARIEWLTSAKLAWRFLSAPFLPRDPFANSDDVEA